MNVVCWKTPIATQYRSANSRYDATTSKYPRRPPVMARYRTTARPKATPPPAAHKPSETISEREDFGLRRRQAAKAGAADRTKGSLVSTAAASNAPPVMFFKALFPVMSSNDIPERKNPNPMDSTSLRLLS